MKLAEMLYPKSSYTRMHTDAAGAPVERVNSMVGVYDINGKLIASGGIKQLKNAGVYGVDHEYQYGRVNNQNFVLLKFALGIDPPEQVNPKKFPNWFKPIIQGGPKTHIDPEKSKEKAAERSRRAAENSRKKEKKELRGEIYVFDDKTHQVIRVFKNLNDVLANVGITKKGLIDSIKNGAEFNGKVFSQTNNWNDVEMKRITKLF